MDGGDSIRGTYYWHNINKWDMTASNATLMLSFSDNSSYVAGLAASLEPFSTSLNGGASSKSTTYTRMGETIYVGGWSTSSVVGAYSEVNLSPQYNFIGRELFDGAFWPFARLVAWYLLIELHITGTDDITAIWHGPDGAGLYTDTFNLNSNI